ncbi:MAG: glyoxalase [Phenylobacterium sp. RIFCSPHIGHO2_01_FULL_69_31]|uniref:VOC family protein n=1 Tax=Phenylobacterium sp. RIFCSPHIGHO2_01_FULL_69_31 TaxID=1801944 RepID=UPI0008D5D195|nr:VOC family protein [Phenylobacterium sp. RIFCSPHIGHO2_01_FULL_69_31]OHB26525.1 MAG: glyoxalase [Phenylobacterium sp. RIFCSPHIGHO2_01_FULL_69_31]
MADWRSPLMSAVVYRDPKAALKFLEAAFGFELFMLIEDGEGNLVHSEMRFRDTAIMVGYEWSDDYKSPASVGGKVTQSVHIQVDTDIDAHCERARAAGMEIVMAPADQFYGARTYRCRDPEGHIWTVAQEVRAVTREEAEAATGLKITGWI